MITKKFFGDIKRELLEFEDLFSRDNKGGCHLNKDFTWFISQHFLSKSKKQDIEKLVSELKALKTNHENLNKKKQEIINEELKVLQETQKTLVQSLKASAEQHKKEFTEFAQKNKEELYKKHLEEISEPLTNKNEFVMEELRKFQRELQKGFTDKKQVENFINTFEKVIPKLILLKETRAVLLELGTYRTFWRKEEDTERITNPPLSHVLRGLVIRIEAGFEPDELIICAEGKHSYKVTSVQKIKDKTQNQTEQGEQQNLNHKEQIEQGEYSASDELE